MKLEMYTFSRVMFWIDSFFSIDEVKSKKKEREVPLFLNSSLLNVSGVLDISLGVELRPGSLYPDPV